MKNPSLAAAFGIAAICLSVSPVLLAEETDTPLDEIVVTADRKARTVDETLAPVSIITRQDIEKYQASSLPDLLRHVPGISFSNSGGVGKTTSVFIRGTNSSHVLVLVDGVKVGSATTGSVAFEDLPLEQVERIEVVRGPRSSLYGSEAIGGVIQIFTRKGGKGFQPEISLGAGSHATQQASINLAGGNKTTWYNLNAAKDKTGGFNATADNQEPDPDGYRRDSVSLRAGHRFTDGTEAEISALHAKGDNHFDGSFNNEAKFVQQAVSAKVKRAFGDKLVLTGQLGQSLDASDNYLNGTPLAAYRRYDTRRDTASLQTDIALGRRGSLTLGADQQNDKVTSDSQYVRTSRANTGLFASYQTDIGKQRLDISARHDDNGQFGSHDTGGVAIGRELGKGMRVTASYGTAFKAPTFNNLYYPYSGDPKLVPEQAKNAEMGVSGKLAGGKAEWSANAFSNSIDNLISYKPPTYAVSQTDKARIQGLELSAKARLANWDVSANATVQHPENRSGVDAGKNLIYRPEQFAGVDVDRDFGRFSTGATLRIEGKRYTDDANTDSQKLPGYGTLDLRTAYKLSKDWTAGLKIGNVLDKVYQTNQGYNQDGINGLVTVKYAPK
jgi:vitamin B12 transporter